MNAIESLKKDIADYEKIIAELRRLLQKYENEERMLEDIRNGK